MTDLSQLYVPSDYFSFSLRCSLRGLAHLRKLEKAATVAFMEMPMSAMAKLNTRKLLGVLSSLTLRKATMVTAFREKPSSPSVEQQAQMLQSWLRSDRAHGGASGVSKQRHAVFKPHALFYAHAPFLHFWQFQCVFNRNNIGSCLAGCTDRGGHSPLWLNSGAKTLTFHQQTRPQRKHIKLGEALW